MAGASSGAGRHSGEQLPYEDELYLLRGLERMFGPATMRQEDALHEALAAAWQQPRRRDRAREWKQVGGWVTEQRRRAAGLIDRPDAAAAQELRRSWGRKPSTVSAWTEELDRATHAVVATTAGQSVTEQQAHSLVEAASVLAPMMVTETQPPLMPVEAEENYVRDVAAAWPTLVANGWAPEVQQAPRWWYAVRVADYLPDPLWFYQHGLVLHLALHTYPPFAAWWHNQLPTVRVAVAKVEEQRRTARDAEAGAKRDRRSQAEAAARMGQEVLEQRWQSQFGPGGVYSGQARSLVGHVDYNGGWTAPNQYWDATIPK